MLTIDRRGHQLADAAAQLHQIRAARRRCNGRSNLPTTAEYLLECATADRQICGAIAQQATEGNRRRRAEKAADRAAWQPPGATAAKSGIPHHPGFGTG